MTTDLVFHSDAQNSHKFYRVEPQGASVTVTYGRIGTAGQSKVHSFPTVGDANKFAAKQVAAKRAKGYVPYVSEPDGRSEAPGPFTAPPDPSAQLANQFEFDNLGQLIASSEWAIEQKLDGHRLMLQGTGTGVKALNRNGQPYAAKNLPTHLGGMILPEGLILDGELMDLRRLDYWVFDIRSLDKSVDTCPLPVRREFLQRVTSSLNLPVHILPQATTEMDKLRLTTLALNNNAEGVVCKHIDSPYIEGRSDTWRKVKFVSTCEAIVVGVRDDGKDSVTLAMVEENGMLVEVGKASLIGREAVSKGDVVEVRYLYATQERRLYQPVMVRRRTDKKPAECTIDQLRYTNREIVSI